MQVAIHHIPVSRVYDKLIKEVIRRGSQKVRCPKGAHAAVVFISDAKMRKMNKTYRGKDKTTNVLAFGTEELKNVGTKEQKVHKFMRSSVLQSHDLGDIFISLPEAKREAKKYGWTMRYEIARLALHGFLHLLGYDHEKEGEAKVMEGIEKKILKLYA